MVPEISDEDWYADFSNQLVLIQTALVKKCVRIVFFSFLLSLICEAVDFFKA